MPGNPVLVAGACAVMGTLVRCSAARGRASGPSRRGLRSSMRRFSGDMARPPHRESPPAVPGRDIWTHRGRLRSRGAREGLGRAPPARCSLGDASALAPQIPAGAALAEEAATASAGNAAISALFGAAVVVLTVLTGSVGYLTFVNVSRLPAATCLPSMWQALQVSQAPCRPARSTTAALLPCSGRTAALRKRSAVGSSNRRRTGSTSSRWRRTRATRRGTRRGRRRRGGGEGAGSGHEARGPDVLSPHATPRLGPHTSSRVGASIDAGTEQSTLPSPRLGGPRIDSFLFRTSVSERGRRRAEGRPGRHRPPACVAGSRRGAVRRLPLPFATLSA